LLSIKRIKTILLKDLKDVIRDSRILVAILTPLLIGVLYNFTFQDDTTPTATIAVAGDDSELPSQLQRAAGAAVNIHIQNEPDEAAVRSVVIDQQDADIGLVIPAGFDEAIKAGQSPELTVILPADPSLAGSLIAGLIDPVLRSEAGQAPPAQIQVVSAEPNPADQDLIDVVGLRSWAVVGSLALSVVMTAMFAVPMVLAEESEKKTLDALVMIASYAEVIIAKALLGIVLVAVTATILLEITNLDVVKPALMLLGMLAMAAALIGAGLLMAGLFKSTAQINTWSGLIVLPFIFPAFVVGLPVPDWVDKLATAFPTGAGTKVLLNSISEITLFPDNPLYFAIMLGWGVLFYGLLLLRLNRRQA
jgi:ABC-2 type transport system permease protein